MTQRGILLHGLQLEEDLVEFLNQIITIVDEGAYYEDIIDTLEDSDLRRGDDVDFSLVYNVTESDIPALREAMDRWHAMNPADIAHQSTYDTFEEVFPTAPNPTMPPCITAVIHDVGLTSYIYPTLAK